MALYAGFLVARPVAAAAVIAAAFSVSNQAWAWCRTTTCDQLKPPPSCGLIDPDRCTTTGTPIRWPNTCVSTSVSAHGSAKRSISPAQLRDVVEMSFKQWTTADCGGGTHPNFVVDLFPDVNCTDVTGDAGYKPTGPNYNLWMFDDDDWPHGAAGEHAIAITTTQFDVNTGLIFDSDVELNSDIQASEFQLTVGDANVGYDLWSVVQHESGHFLGLSHSDVSFATMFATLGPNELAKRALSQDDIDGICNAYPPGTLDPNCDPEPRHGFSTECTFEKGCCTVAPGRVNRARRLTESLIVGAFLVVAVRRRRRKNSVDQIARQAWTCGPARAQHVACRPPSR